MWLPTKYGNLLIDIYSTGIQCTVGYTGACKLKSDHTVGYTGACKLKSDHTVGYTGACKLKSDHTVGYTGACKLKSDYTVGYTGANVQMVCFKQNSIQR